MLRKIVFQRVAGGDNNTKNKTIHYSQKIKRKGLIILQRSSKSFVRIYKRLNTINV